MSRIILCIAAINFVSCSGITVETKDNFELVELPDNSFVYLNHNSFIKYSEDFSPRTIELTGEAFFDVVPAGSPFIVTTTIGEIKVTGTAFNVVADKEMLDVEVEEGSVAVKTQGAQKQLIHGQRATYEKGAKNMQKAKADKNYKKWMNELQAAFIKMGKEFRTIGRESKTVGKDIKKESNRLKRRLKDL